ncbi:hypothetical protein PPSIR1_25051 [Plesiocystis pacifica SIR-1]|uniref:FIST C-domain domain-containing protein n=1 Tax=Plesiocystis pacifica SIR-1 TaxID=391625 RepID=A6GDV8_9BACT|nr:FIST C-terminal domain-containing protein [Plesiocystis pacifica]EDM75907.1 hypothetical protein PPSIR1_25051 [Plesiocystis pacifica SIR-1]
MDIATVTSLEADTRAAFSAAYAALVGKLGGPPDWLIVQSAVRHEVATLREAARLSGVEQLHGSSSCLGVMSDAGVDTAGGLGLFGLRDSDGDFGVGSAPLGDDPAAAAGAALRQAIANAQREGELPELVWVSASPGTEERCIAGIEAEIGAGAPIVGGSAADDAVAGGWYLFDAHADYGSGIVVSVLYPSTGVHSVFHSGYSPTTTTGTVTAATGRAIETIDGDAAAATYDRWTGGAVGEALEAGGSVLGSTTLHPIGRRVGEDGGVSYYRLAHPESVTAEGHLVLFAEVSVGDELILMTGSTDALRSRAGRVAADALARARRPSSEIAGALVIFCAGCMLTIRDELDDVVASLRGVLGDVPFLGGFTFGEQGCFVGGENCHGNLMISVTVFERA